MFQISTTANFETEVYELLKLFLLVQVKIMMKTSAINALQLPKWSKLTIFSFFSRPHYKTPNLTAFWEISFWNGMFLCWIKTEMFTVADRNWIFSCKCSTMRLARDFSIVLLCRPCQMRWNEFKYSFYHQKPAYFPRTYLWIVYKMALPGSSSIYRQNFKGKNVKDN